MLGATEVMGPPGAGGQGGRQRSAGVQLLPAQPVEDQQDDLAGPADRLRQPSGRLGAVAVDLGQQGGHHVGQAGAVERREDGERPDGKR